MPVILAGVRLLLGLLPVFSFLVALILLDSYKLVRLSWVARVVVAGALTAVASLFCNRLLANVFGIEGVMLARYGAPVVEELLKGAVVALLIIRRRVGFQVDAAIFGFAVGAGFAAVENLHYFVVLGDPSLPLWVIRGFGTAVMHGSVTAIMAMVSKLLADRRGGPHAWVFLPGWLVATALHSVFNHFFLAPNVEAGLMLAVLPVFFVAVFHISEIRTRDWLGVGFDTDAELLELIGSGKISDSRIGGYLQELRGRFPPTTVADMLCLLRLRVELSIRAKGVLLARKSGFTLPPDPEMEERFAELRFLERAIGPTGLLAIKPIFHMSDRDLWQYHTLMSG
jgi:RsiW-degrading membrane proteinase PrsW (M82 family)